MTWEEIDAAEFPLFGANKTNDRKRLTRKQQEEHGGRERRQREKAERRERRQAETEAATEVEVLALMAESSYEAAIVKVDEALKDIHDRSFLGAQASADHVQTLQDVKLQAFCEREGGVMS